MATLGEILDNGDTPFPNIGSDIDTWGDDL
jgi:hypothetical protein